MIATLTGEVPDLENIDLEKQNGLEVGEDQFEEDERIDLPWWKMGWMAVKMFLTVIGTIILVFGVAFALAFLIITVASKLRHDQEFE
jgi:hypothetical protein